MAKLALPGISLPGISVSSTGDEGGPLARFVAGWGLPLITFALLAVAGWLLVAWVLYFFAQSELTNTAPGPASASGAPSMSRLGETIAAGQLFGLGASAPVAAPSTLAVKLRGVFASNRNGPGAAILNTGAKDEFVVIGREVLPGVVLAEVHPSHVVLQRGAALERVNLEERSAGPSVGGASPARPPVRFTPPAPTFTPPPPTQSPPAVPQPQPFIPGIPQPPPPAQAG